MNVNRHSVYQNFTSIRAFHTSQDLDQCGLSSTICPNQPMDFTSIHAEVHLIKGLHPRKMLGQAPSLKNYWCFQVRPLLSVVGKRTDAGVPQPSKEPITKKAGSSINLSTRNSPWFPPLKLNPRNRVTRSINNPRSVLLTQQLERR